MFYWQNLYSGKKNAFSTQSHFRYGQQRKNNQVTDASQAQKTAIKQQPRIQGPALLFTASHITVPPPPPPFCMSSTKVNNRMYKRPLLKNIFN